jgi:hypothetical protein
MENETITIRAAGLSRLIKTIHSVTSDDPEFIFKNPETKGLFDEIVKNETITMFYTADTRLLAKLCADIVKFYNQRPIIHSKITLLWGAELAASLLAGKGKVESKNPRSKEIKELSKAFYEMSELIQDKEVSANVEFVEIQDTMFHPDSKYAKFTVKR